jgi:hypothetical protein
VGKYKQTIVKINRNGKMTGGGGKTLTGKNIDEQGKI